MDELLTGLRAAAEPTRLRLLALCSGHELTVTELTQILGQSQPRVSRHLKILCDSGLLERFPEGACVFYRLHRSADCLAEKLVALIPGDDELRQRDSLRLSEIQARRAVRAASYFEANAHRWDAIRGLYVPEAEVEQALAELIKDLGAPLGEMLDIGTGTGRMLDVLAPYVTAGVGIDSSREMLSVARVNLSKAPRHHCAVRQADMYALPFEGQRFDLVLFHQVLHYAERPADAIIEAVRVLHPGGALIIVDFLRHGLEFLREQHAHIRLGFTEAELRELIERAGLRLEPALHLPGKRLTVAIWIARAPRAADRRDTTSNQSVQTGPVAA